ncbi:MAG: DUF1365 domain-containing protein [Anaerosomatales bacterium]|nr:DUF1365 domain-containing protein [Coriobacteriia bacterium]MDF1542061.1 DUF1365 domain-containing protein [Anaerosomatales bacterium]MDT8433703.1 DUF1365 domain-containing protein [Anaerosomatales bacterium]
METPVHSTLYVGTVAHERKVPRVNRFRYGVYFVYADLDELDALDASLRLFSVDRPNLFSLRLKDHGPRDGSPWRPWIDATLARAGIDLEGGPVRLLTFPRVLGFKFYPVSFWYCFHADGTPIAVLAEVQNTFGDHHNYLLHNGGAPYDWRSSPEKVKVFHVSPFIEMDARYRFHVSEPAERLSVSIFDYVKGPLLLVAAVSLGARPLTDGQIVRTFLRFGPMSARAWLLIHFQALRIVAKRIKYVPRTEPPAEETT